jgi:hypothetical protein
MKRIIFLLIAFCVAQLLQAQEIFFPQKEGTVLTYKTFDKKEKETGTIRYTVKSIKKSGDNMDITYQYESIDTKDKPLFNDEITVHKKGDVLYFDMSNFINKAAFQQNGKIPAEVQVTGNNMEIPLNPAAGASLPDASVEMAMKMGFVNMKISASVTNRKFEGKESLTTKAGTFDAYRFSGLVSTSSIGIKMNTTINEWYAKGIGIVKSVNLDKSGKMVSYIELAEVK